MQDAPGQPRAGGAEEETLAQFVAEARVSAQSIVDTLREPLVVLDAELRVVAVNYAFYETFRVPPEETLGRPLYELGNRQCDLSRFWWILG